MASKGKRRKKSSRGGQLDLEAIGLVLLALGVFVLGLLIPQMPTGDLGRTLRELGVSRIGLGVWALPWPPLVLGALFLLRRNPKRWPRVLLGYVLLAAGLWSLLMLAAPPLSGRWGQQLRAVLAGAAGWLAYLPAAVVVTLGIEFILGWTPTRIVRGTLRRTLQGLRAGVKAGLAARSRIKDRAAFHADVALARTALNALDKDLQALSTLYPGSVELDRWRKAVVASRRRLNDPETGDLADVQADLEAWQSAVEDFARDRARELAGVLQAEGVADFDAWSQGLKAQLSDPVPSGAREVGKAARALDDVRKALALDLTALGERHRKLTRERDLSVAELERMRPRELARASERHGKRLGLFRIVADDADALETDADRLEPWRELIDKLTRLAAEFPEALDEEGELRDYADTLSAELRSQGRAALDQAEGWGDALAAVELRVREAAARRRAAPAADAASLEPGAALDAALLEPGADPADPADPADDAFAAFAGDDEADEDDALAAFDPAAAYPFRTAASGPAADAPFVVTEVDPADGDAAEADPAAERPGPEVGGIPIQLPDLDLLDPADPGHHEDPAALAKEVQARVRKIDETLANFNLEGRVVSSVRGPTVTRFEVEPAPGEKISRFANLSDDLALAMAVGSVRIEAPIPGKSVIGLEVPNANRDLIRFREAAEAGSFRRAKARLPLILGKSIDGEMVVGDLAKMPHLLIAGSTGSGKSVAVNTLIGSLLYKFLPTELRFLMIDPKMVELTPFDGVPHLIRPVVTNPGDAAGVLLGAVAHMERRYKMMSKIGAKNLDQYNEKARNLDLPEMPFITIVIDELADLMITSPKEVESAIMRLAQMARATGMHLVLATQRPSVDILTSLIKVNVPARVAFAVSSSHDSRTILDSMGAERLIGMGDMLFYQPGLVKPVRLQGPFISEAEIGQLAAFLRRQYFDDDFVEAYGSDFDPPSMHDSDASGLIDWNDDKLRDAAELVIHEGQASVSRLQRRLQVGHARAGKLMDSLEALGVVGPHVGSKPRDVLVEMGELPEIFGK